MLTEVHWIEGFWPGKLGLSARPRGGDWLEDEVSGWQRAGVSTIISLLTPEEEGELALTEEAAEARRYGLTFVSFPIADRDAPASQSQLAEVLDKVQADLSSGRPVVIHCRQGIGRTGLVASCLPVANGLDPGAAVELVGATRRALIPDTQGQREWIDSYAKSLAAPLLS